MISFVNVLTLIFLAVLAVLVYQLRSHPQEWENLVPNRLRRWRAFWTARRLAGWVGIPLTCWAVVLFISNRTELAEAYAHIKCGNACPALTAQELRWRFIKSYLHYALDRRKPASDGWGYDQLVLLPVNLNAQSLVQGLENATLLTTLTTNALPLKTHEAIDALTPNVPAAYPSIAGISLSYRHAVVIPLQSIQPIRLENVDADYTPYDPHKEVTRRIGRWEKLRGYGKHFFEVTEYWGLDLSCCDGTGTRKNEESLAERKKKGINYLQSHSKDAWVLASSDRGNLLLWENVRGEMPDLTPFLFLIKSPF